MECPDCGEPLDRQGLCELCDETETPEPVSMAPPELKPGEVGRIESGVPIPPRVTPPRDSKYPWATMKPGDSFPVKPLPPQTERQLRATVNSSFHTWAKKAGKQGELGCKIRTVDGVVHAWLVKK